MLAKTWKVNWCKDPRWRLTRLQVHADRVEELWEFEEGAAPVSYAEAVHEPAGGARPEGGKPAGGAKPEGGKEAAAAHQPKAKMAAKPAAAPPRFAKDKPVSKKKPAAARPMATTPKAKGRKTKGAAGKKGV